MRSSYRHMLLPVLNVLGPIFIGFSLTMLIPLALSLWKQDGASLGFQVSFCFTFFAGVVLWLGTRRFRRELIPRDGFLLVTLAWVMLSAVSAIPLYIEVPNISAVDAFFEATSGLTTTCATVLSGLDQLPFSVNFWRCFLSWMGGIGILVMAVAVLPLLGVGGAQIFRAETTGPLKESKLTPRIADTAKAFYLIYLAFSALCAVAYHFAGMNWDDAVMHMFSTVSLGGFSSYDDSFAHWNSSAIDTVAIIFLLVGGVNFSMHFLAWKKLSLKVYLTDPESRAWLITAFLCVFTVTCYLFYKGTYKSLEESFYYASFNVVSVISTGGFANTDYGQWPLAVQVLMLIVSSFATCAGSTGGGIKMIRAIALMKQGAREFSRILHPKLVSPLKVGTKLIDSNVIFAVLAFLMLYIIIAVISTGVFLISGLDGLTSLSAALSCLNNLGPGLGSLGPASSFGELNSYQTLFCVFLMIIGRLELFTVLVLFTRSFWRA